MLFRSPLLDDPSFLPLHPLLQRNLLLAMPRSLASALGRRQSMGSMVLVATTRDQGLKPRVLGLIVARPINRRGTCWEVQHLRLALGFGDDDSADGTAASLLREAIRQAPGAVSWVASASTMDTLRLSVLRQQGFQPQRTERVWRWQGHTEQPAAPLSPSLQLRPLQRRTAALLWHLEQATCPAPLRQMLDRRIEDLLDRSEGHGWLLVDVERNEAVAGARWLADHPAGGHQVELSVHPGWAHLLGPATELLLRRLAPQGDQIWLHSAVDDVERLRWLSQIGAEDQGDVVLMARSLWRRQDAQPNLGAAERISAVLQQLQPRRRSIPTPLGQR